VFSLVLIESSRPNFFIVDTRVMSQIFRGTCLKKRQRRGNHSGFVAPHHWLWLQLGSGLGFLAVFHFVVLFSGCDGVQQAS